MKALETDPAKILEANKARQEKAWEFDDLLRENSVVRIMADQILDLQKDRDRLFRRVQELERRRCDEASVPSHPVTWAGVVNDLSEVGENAMFMMDNKIMMKTCIADYVVLSDKQVMDRIEKMLDEAEALARTTPIDRLAPNGDAGGPAQGGH